MTTGNSYPLAMTTGLYPNQLFGMVYTTYKDGDQGDGLWHCYTNITHFRTRGPQKIPSKIPTVQDCVGALQDLDLALQIEPDNPFALLGCAGGRPLGIIPSSDVFSGKRDIFF